MDRAEAAARADDRADDDRAALTLSRQEPVLRHLIDDAVHREREEVAEHDLEDRSQPRDRRAVGGTGQRQLRDRRVEDACRPVLLVQPRRDREDAAGDRDVLAEEDHALVPLELLVEGLPDRVPELDVAVALHGSAGLRNVGRSLGHGDWPLLLGNLGPHARDQGAEHRGLSLPDDDLLEHSFEL